MEQWHKLDVAANLFPSVTNNSNSSVYRVATVLSEEIDEVFLQKALDKIIGRFPMLFSHMRKGLFWNYFDSNNMKFLVQKETSYPCENINSINNNGYLIRVLYFKNRVSVEAFHALTDGGGVIEFLKSLIYYYLSYKYGDFDSENKILLYDDFIENNMSDGFREHFENNKNVKKKSKSTNEKSYHIKGTLFKENATNIITGIISAKKLNQIAKSKDATITSYLASVMIYSIYHAKQKYENNNSRPIVIAVPVNLRRIFPSKSLKNFFGVVNLSFTMNENTSIDEVIREISNQLKMYTSKESLTESVSTNVSISNNKLSKIVPLPIKNVFVSLGFNHFGEEKKTITISNIGNIQIPEGMKKYVEHFEAALYPTQKSPINCGVISVNDKLSISFSRRIEEKNIIRYFFKYLAENDKLDVSVYSNDWRNNYEGMQ